MDYSWHRAAVWILMQVYLQKRSIHKHLQHKIIFSLVYRPKKNQKLSFSGATAAPGSNSCSAGSQILQQAGGSCPCSSNVVTQLTEGIHVSGAPGSPQLHHQLQCWLRSTTVCGPLLPAQLSQDLKMSWTGLKFSCFSLC